MYLVFIKISSHFMWYTRSINTRRCLYHLVKTQNVGFCAKEKNLSAQAYAENSILSQKQNNLSFVFQSTESFETFFKKGTSEQQ